MFMIVSYPWPVPSAHIELPGTSRHAPGDKPQQQDHPAAELDEQSRILISAKA
jgi:hypothetical protein